MYGFHSEGEPFQVFARRETAGESLVFRFECNDGMGILGVRKVGRQDPAPATVYEEADIDPASLRAGRFVHVLPSGQRQSYALSRIAPEIAARLPTDKWVELKPHSEYGFRYLVAPEDQLVDPSKPAVVAVAATAAPASAAAGAPSAPAPAAAPRNPPSLPPTQTPMSPALAEAALKAMGKDQAIEALKGEMAKVDQLHRRVTELQAELEKSRARERDLLDLLGRWQQQ